MPSGRHTAFRPDLTAPERLELDRWTRSPNVSARKARRAKGLLLVDGGMTIKGAALTIGLTRQHLYKWLKRWLAHGYAGLSDARKRTSGHKERINAR